MTIKLWLSIPVGVFLFGIGLFMGINCLGAPRPASDDSLIIIHQRQGERPKRKSKELLRPLEKRDLCTMPVTTPRVYEMSVTVSRGDSYLGRITVLDVIVCTRVNDVIDASNRSCEKHLAGCPSTARN